VLRIAEGIAGGGVFYTDRSGNISGVAGLQILAVIRVHLKDSSEALAFLTVRVVDACAGIDRSRIDAEEAQLADKGVGCDLESQSSEGLVVGGFPLELFARLGIDAINRRNIQRRRQVIHDRIQQLLDALISVGSSAGHRNEFVLDGAFPDGGFELLYGGLLAFQVFFHQPVVHLGGGLDHLFAVFLCEVHHVLRNIANVDLRTHLVKIIVSLHFKQIDEPDEIGLGADRELNHDRIALEPLHHHIDDVKEICARDVHLVDVHHSRHVILICLTPHGLRLGLDAAFRAENGYGTIQHAKRALHLDGKIDVPGGVDDIDAVALPMGGGGGGSDRDATLLLLLHPVHRGIAVVRLADLIIHSGIVENPFGRSRLTGVNVGHDPDISGHLKGNISWHKNSSIVK
jgi:hypothetical protein